MSRRDVPTVLYLHLVNEVCFRFFLTKSTSSILISFDVTNHPVNKFLFTLVG